MKFNKLAVSVLCLFTVAVCANAQPVKTPKKDSKTEEKLENVLQKRVLKARRVAKAVKCRWCGEAVVEGRKCPADPDVYCMPAPKTVKAKKARKAAQPAKQAARCPNCLEEYSIDVLYYGIRHKCKDNCRSGEPEAGFYWVESAASDQQDACDGEPHSNLVSVSVAEEAGPHGEPEMPGLKELDLLIANKAEILLQKDRDANNGRAKHTFEYYYNQVAQQSAQAEKCRRCGEPVVEGRRCSADPDVYCMPAPKAEKVQKEQKTLQSTKPAETRCPKCGEEYDIDVLYHGMQHHCEAK